MTRSIIKAAEWTLGPETGEGAPQAIYSAGCMECGEESLASDNDRAPVEIWALKHTGRNPSHRQYNAMIETYWRVTPAEGNPYRESDAHGAQPHPQHQANGSKGSAHDR
ncbi:hypothetical protein [Streptomyces sp. NL15-2K]|uniref:DUF7848 domain-containing protein n=1 Tax=Streptomyces sp. NL15-2K TaxID=376149 RepID=UPI000F58C4C4|nr:MULTISPECIES: hypothetical protein [Actinomycetes]WKX13017.1 hypothetical protein Q4V64_38040 [Kutzneria buriramensis]